MSPVWPSSSRSGSPVRPSQMTTTFCPVSLHGSAVAIRRLSGLNAAFAVDGWSSVITTCRPGWPPGAPRGRPCRRDPRPLIRADRLQCQQDGALGIRLDIGRCGGGELPGERDAFLPLGATALHDREPPVAARRRAGRPPRRAARAAAGSSGAGARPPARSPAGPRTGTFARARSAPPRVPTPSRLCPTAGASVEVAGFPVALVPLLRCLGQVRPESVPLEILLEPAREPRPLADQGLVRHLDPSVARREEAVLREAVEDGAGHYVAVDVELGGGNAAADRRVALVAAHEPEQDPSGRLLLDLRQLLIRALSQARYRTPHATGRFVRLEREARPRRALTRARRARWTAGQPAGLPSTSAGQRVAERRFDMHAGAPGGARSRVAARPGS